MKKNNLIITKKIWNIKNFKKIKKKVLIFNKINKSELKRLNPNIIFFIFWSKIIKENVFKKYNCIQFHAADLPNGRGGSPVQNQILRGKKNTKITAFKVSKNLDSGPIILKKKLSLGGSAQKIYENIEKISIKMISEILNMKKIFYKEQKGYIKKFNRRKKNESIIDFNKIFTIKKFYDFIRMLDANGYPRANFKIKKFNFELKKAKLINGSLIAEMKVLKK